MDDPQTRKLALRGITLLEEAIKKDFGLTAQLGAELEFRAFDINDPENRTPLELSSEGKNYGHPKRLFVHSPFISTEYKELGSNAYELVFHHNSNHNSGGVLARAIEGAKKELMRRQPFVAILEEGAKNRSILVKGGKRVKRGEVKENIRISLAPVVDASLGETTCALQINIGLVDQNKRSVLSHPLSKALINATLPMQAEMAFLHLPHDESYGRIDKGVALETHIERGGTLGWREHDLNANPTYSHHIENRLAGADADPYCVILTTLAGVYHALRQCTKPGVNGLPDFSYEALDDLPDTFGPIPETRNDALKVFRKGTLLRGILNEVSGEENLGEQFCNSVSTAAAKEQNDILASHQR